jgi:hypothetical protein
MAKFHFVLTSKGGLGHESAAAAIVAQIKKASDNYLLINTVLQGWFAGGGPNLGYKFDKYFYKLPINLGPVATGCWDWAQRTSSIEIVRFIALMHKLTFLNIPSFRYRAYDLLKKIRKHEDYKHGDEIIFHNTQPICLAALVSSVARYNREIKAKNKQEGVSKYKTVKLINYFTDLPTSDAKMLISEVSKIDVADLDDAEFELHTRPPIIDTSTESAQSIQSADSLELAYHAKAKKLYPKLYENLEAGRSRVKFTNGPIREEFLDIQKHPVTRSEGIAINFEKETININISETEEVTSIMLGSQASIDGTISLVQAEIAVARSSTSTRPKKVFVFCGKDDPAAGFILYQKIKALSEQASRDLQNNITIIPLTNQSASMIARLYSIADKIITRPGGLSIMEIEAVARTAKIIVFTELSKLSKFINKIYLIFGWTKERLKKYYLRQSKSKRYKELVAWEAGNAKHIASFCVDRHGRPRVVLANEYTYEQELKDLERAQSAPLPVASSISSSVSVVQRPVTFVREIQALAAAPVSADPHEPNLGSSSKSSSKSCCFRHCS